MIGLLDLDLQTSVSTKSLIPNIEIMKLATYYKIEENQFCKLVDLMETDLSIYDKIYCFSEANTPSKLPAAFLSASNLILGGTGFTNGVYKPFKNEIIDFTLPRPTIYQQFLKEKYESGIQTKVIEHVLDDTYYRNYAGKNKLPLPAIIPKKRVILYDRDFFYPDWEKTIQTISDRKCSSIIRLHPIICHKLSEYFAVRKYIKINRTTDFILDLKIPLDDLNYMFKHYKNLFLADINPSSNVYIPFGGTQNTYLQYANEIKYKMNLLFSFWSRGIMLKIKYVSPETGSENPFEDLCKIIESWASNSNLKRKETTVLQRIPKKKDYNYIREQYEILLKYAPKTINLFNRSVKQICEGGEWRYEY